MMRQGDIIEIENTDLKEKFPDANLLLVITHCCDIANDSTSIEVLPCHKIDTIDGNFTLGKHPRKLQFKVDNLIIEVRSNEKERIHLNSDEIVSVKMSIYKNRIVLQNWLAFQYRRHAIDSKINEIFKKIGLRDIAKKYLSNLIGIWLDITDDDFENDYIYLSAYFVFDVDMPNIVQHEQQLKEIIGSKLEKMKLKKEQLIIFCFYENDFSLYQARNLMFLNFDYLSGY